MLKGSGLPGSKDWPNSNAGRIIYSFIVNRNRPNVTAIACRHCWQLVNKAKPSN